MRVDIQTASEVCLSTTRRGLWVWDQALCRQCDLHDQGMDREEQGTHSLSLFIYLFNEFRFFFFFFSFFLLFLFYFSIYSYYFSLFILFICSEWMMINLSIHLLVLSALMWNLIWLLSHFSLLSLLERFCTLLFVFRSFILLFLFIYYFYYLPSDILDREEGCGRSLILKSMPVMTSSNLIPEYVPFSFLISFLRSQSVEILGDDGGV
jgi:hypothetical protein